MISFTLSLIALILGYIFYGKFVETVFGPNEKRKTPGIRKFDGVDYLVLPSWKVFMIQFLNIGKDCMIGAGSVVVSDIPGGVTAFGNPCRVKIYNEKDNNMINSDLMFMGG